MFDKREILNITEYWIYCLKQIVENNQKYWRKEAMNNSACTVLTVLQTKHGDKHLPQCDAGNINFHNPISIFPEGK